MLRIMKYTWILFCIFTLSAQAEIYRWVDHEGNVVFSDESHPQAEVIEISPSTVISPDNAITTGDAEADAILKLSPDDVPPIEEPTVALPAYQLRVIAPANDESIWVNNGDVTVSLIVEPQLDIERGDMIVLSLDGATVGEPQATTSFQLPNLSRGSHTVSASIVSNTGTVMTSSDAITFHLHRTSVLNKPAQQKAN